MNTEHGDELELRPNGDVVRTSDDKVVARVEPDKGGEEAIKYAHHSFHRYAAAIVELMQEGASEGEPEEAPAPKAKPAAPRAYRAGDPAPAQDPTLGDLTPDYIEWFLATKTPEEIKKRYRNGMRLMLYEKEKKKNAAQE